MNEVISDNWGWGQTLRHNARKTSPGSSSSTSWFWRWRILQTVRTTRAISEIQASIYNNLEDQSWSSKNLNRNSETVAEFLWHQVSSWNRRPRHLLKNFSDCNLIMISEIFALDQSLSIQSHSLSNTQYFCDNCSWTLFVVEAVATTSVHVFKTSGRGHLLLKFSIYRELPPSDLYL